jgi:hypothetical protein
MSRTFEYLLNAMEAASQEKNPAEHGYAEKRRRVFECVRAAEQRAERLQQQAEIMLQENINLAQIAERARQEALEDKRDAERWRFAEKHGMPVRNQTPRSEAQRWVAFSPRGAHLAAEPSEAVDIAIRALAQKERKT